MAQQSSASAESNQLDSHSLFVGDLPHDLTDVGLHQHFQNLFASAISAKVITDRLSGRSKGYGFVRFTSSEERDRALSIMHGQKIGQQTIRVNRAKAKKYQGDGLYYPSDYDLANTTAFVGNVNADITEEDLYSVFKRCGEIVSVKLLKAKSCAFVTYAQRDAAERAITYLHGKVIKNSAVRICWGRRSIHNSIPMPDPALMTFAQQALSNTAAQQQMAAFHPQSPFPAQAFLPSAPIPPSTLYPSQDVSAQPGFAFPSRHLWRPDVLHDFQNHPFSGQLGGFQPGLQQQYASHGMPNLPAGFGLQQPNQEAYLGRRFGHTLSSRDQALLLSMGGQEHYRATSAGPTAQPSILTDSGNRGQQSIAEAQEAFARLSLGPQPGAGPFE